MSAKKTIAAKNGRARKEGLPEPKRLSKFGEWMRAHPKGYIEILDWRAVTR